VYTYPGIGHFYTDADGPDHDEAAAGLTWERVAGFLSRSARGSA
jgi:dienelactone hydrolase